MPRTKRPGVTASWGATLPNSRFKLPAGYNAMRQPTKMVPEKEIQPSPTSAQQPQSLMVIPASRPSSTPAFRSGLPAQIRK